MLSGGGAVATIIGIVAAPVLGRLYTPAEYGKFGAYAAVASILATVGNWQFSQGVVVEKYESKALSMVSASVVASLVTSGIAAVIGVCYWLMSADSNTVDRSWYLLLPASTMLGGLTSAWTAWANRRRRYSEISTARIVNAVVTAVGSVGFGFLGFGVAGLFLAYFSALSATAALYGWYHNRSIGWRLKKASWRRTFSLARKHRAFALYTTPAEFVGSFAMQAPIFALGLLSATEMIGLLSRARQLLSLPITLLGGSIAQVFLQRASADYAATGSCRMIYGKVLVLLVGAGLVPMIVFAVMAPTLFEVFLGPDWTKAGEVARILAPMLMLRLVCGPLSTVFSIVGAQREDLMLMVTCSLLTSFAVALPCFGGWGSIWVVVGFSCAYSMTYIIYLIRAYQLSA